MLNVPPLGRKLAKNDMASHPQWATQERQSLSEQIVSQYAQASPQVAQKCAHPSQELQPPHLVISKLALSGFAIHASQLIKHWGHVPAHLLQCSSHPLQINPYCSQFGQVPEHSQQVSHTPQYSHKSVHSLQTNPHAQTYAPQHSPLSQPSQIISHQLQ